MSQEEIIVSGPVQDSRGKWFGESRMVPEEEAYSAEREYAEARIRYENDPDGAGREDRAIGGAAIKNSGELFFVPPNLYPEANQETHFGVGVVDADDGSIPGAGY